MVRQNTIGERDLMRCIPPSDVEKMDEDKIVVVSRICVNKRLMEIKISSNPNDQKSAEPLIKALNEARSHERKRSGSVSNVRMTVGDLKKAFISLKNLPANSLKIMGR